MFELNERVETGMQMFKEALIICDTTIECYVQLSAIWRESHNLLEIVLEIQRSGSTRHLERDLRTKAQQFSGRVMHLDMLVNGFNAMVERGGVNAMSQHAMLMKEVMTLLEKAETLYKKLGISY